MINLQCTGASSTRLEIGARPAGYCPRQPAALAQTRTEPISRWRLNASRWRQQQGDAGGEGVVRLAHIGGLACSPRPAGAARPPAVRGADVFWNPPTTSRLSQRIISSRCCWYTLSVLQRTALNLSRYLWLRPTYSAYWEIGCGRPTR